MPACQIQRIFGLVKSLNMAEVSPALWIDTLCVPLDEIHRKMAISRFCETYRGAIKVLILDRRLAKVECGDQCEQMAYILCSEWMSRLWTLQEGLLASNLFFQFKDEATPLSNLLNSNPNERPTLSADIVERQFRQEMASKFHLRDRFSDILESNERSRRPDEVFLAIMGNLMRRRTTKAKDEPICLATLLELDLALFPSMPSMEDIYWTQRKLPRNLIFASSPRLTTPGLRWAPSTFLQQPPGALRTSCLSEFGYLTSRGFEIQGTCLKLSDSWTIAKKNDKAYMIEDDKRECKYFFLPNFRDYPEFKERHIKSPALFVDLGQSTGINPAILIDVTHQGRSYSGNYVLPGFLVEIARTSPHHFPHNCYETIRSNYFCTQSWVVD